MRSWTATATRSRSNSCTGDGPRGAWNAASFVRQQAKIVNAINTIDADVVSLEEIENSRKVDDDPEPRRGAVARWWTRSTTTPGRPAGPSSPPRPRRTCRRRRGAGRHPHGLHLQARHRRARRRRRRCSSASARVRQRPRAAGPGASRPAGCRRHATASPSSSTTSSPRAAPAPPATTSPAPGQCFNGDRTRQAQAWRRSPTGSPPTRGVDAVFLTGDFNAYSKEDPMQVLDDRRLRADSSPTTADEESLLLRRLVRLARPRLRQRGG